MSIFEEFENYIPNSIESFSHYVTINAPENAKRKIALMELLKYQLFNPEDEFEYSISHFSLDQLNKISSDELDKSFRFVFLSQNFSYNNSNRFEFISLQQFINFYFHYLNNIVLVYSMNGIDLIELRSYLYKHGLSQEVFTQRFKDIFLSLDPNVMYSDLLDFFLTELKKLGKISHFNIVNQQIDEVLIEIDGRETFNISLDEINEN